MLRRATIMMEASHAVVVMDIGWTPMDTPAMVIRHSRAMQ